MAKYFSILLIIFFTFYFQKSFSKNKKNEKIDCVTYSGDMLHDSIIACIGENVSSQIISGWQNDGNDTLVYYLHEGNLDSIINPIDSNYTGIFTPKNIKYNKFYYISSVAADTNAIGWINLKDDCKSTSIGTPVVWIKTNIEKKEHVTCRDYFALNATKSLFTTVVKWSSDNALLLKFIRTNDSISSNLIDTVKISTQNKTVNIYFEQSNNYCDLRDTIKINFTDSLLVDFSIKQAKCYQDQSINDSTNFIFTANPINLSKYTWDFGTGNIVSSSNSNTECNVFWKSDTTHIVSLVASNCPEDTITKTITEPAKLYFNFNNISATCYQNNGKMVAHPMKGGLSYKNYNSIFWQPDPQIPQDHQFDTIQTNIHSGSYKISIQDEFCKASQYSVVNDSGLVKSVFTASPTEGIAEELEVKFTNNSYAYYLNDTTSSKSAVWEIQHKILVIDTFKFYIDTVIAGEFNSDLYSPNYTYLDSGKFKVSLIAISNEGCRDTSYDYINVSIHSILGEGETSDTKNGLPNYFTPNGDGIYDNFSIKIQSLEIFEGQIFNRWGRIVYEWNNPNDEGWDGNDKWTNQPAPAGVYFYVIKGRGKDGTVFKDPENYGNGKGFKKETLTGFVTLIRNNFEK